MSKVYTDVENMRSYQKYLRSWSRSQKSMSREAECHGEEISSRLDDLFFGVVSRCAEGLFGRTLTVMHEACGLMFGMTV